MASNRTKRIIRFSAAIALTFSALPFVGSQPAVADPTAGASASIGVQVFQPTTTLPPTTTTTARPPVVPPAPTTVPSTAAPTSSTTPTTSTTLEPTTFDTLPDLLPTPVTVNDSSPKGFVSQVRSAAKTTKDLVKGIASGQPIADVAQAVLPENVATVVVPAVRTASTFVFPIGLAGAVISFLVLQQRIDASDPKLNAAPLAHDDEMVTFS